MPDEIVNVLLIEDDEEDYIITREFLESSVGQTFKLQWADRLQKGLALLEDEGVDVVLLDLSLPDASGWETFLTVRSRAPSAPVVLLTGLNDTAMGIKAVQEGAQDYLVKGSITPDQLVRSIRYAIERKRTEKSLKRYQDHLEELVSERTAELRKAFKRLEEHDRAQSQFVSNVSHELKTPLASITYAVDNLLKGVVGPVPERVTSYLKMLKEDAQRLTSTVSDILDLSRIEANTLVLNRVRLPFTRFVSQAVDSVRFQAGMKQHELTCETRNCTGFLECDPQKMERAILNVVENAIKYTPKGGQIDVVVHCDDQEEGVLAIDVSDNGVGIEVQHLERVTERYFRVGEHINGTGLGLALCKEIVELHGGTLRLQSPPPGGDKGTMVSIHLPNLLHPKALSAVRREGLAASVTQGLMEAGFDVIPLPEDADVVERLRGAPPDIVLADMGSPRDGMELIVKMKADHDLRALPVVALADEDALQDVDRGVLQDFGVSVLYAPWRDGLLRERVEEAVLRMQHPG